MRHRGRRTDGDANGGHRRLGAATSGASYAEYLILIVAVVIGGMAGWQYLGRQLDHKTRRAAVALREMEASVVDGREGRGPFDPGGPGRGGGGEVGRGGGGLIEGATDVGKDLIDIATGAIDAGADVVTGAGETVADGAGGCLADWKRCGDGIVHALAEYGEFGARVADMGMFGLPGDVSARYAELGKAGDALWSAIKDPDEAWAGLQQGLQQAKDRPWQTAKAAITRGLVERARHGQESFRFRMSASLGLGKQGVDTATGLANMILHPKRTIDGVAYMATHGEETKAMAQGGLEGIHDTIMNGSIDEQGELAGRGLFEAGLTIGTAGSFHATKARYASYAGRAGRSARAVASIRSASDAAAVIRAGGGAVKVWAAGKAATAGRMRTAAAEYKAGLGTIAQNTDGVRNLPQTAAAVRAAGGIRQYEKWTDDLRRARSEDLATPDLTGRADTDARLVESPSTWRAIQDIKAAGWTFKYMGAVKHYGLAVRRNSNIRKKIFIQSGRAPEDMARTAAHEVGHAKLYENPKALAKFSERGRGDHGKYFQTGFIHEGAAVRQQIRAWKEAPDSIAKSSDELLDTYKNHDMNSPEGLKKLGTDWDSVKPGSPYTRDYFDDVGLGAEWQKQTELWGKIARWHNDASD